MLVVMMKTAQKKCGLCKSGSCDIVTGQCDQSGCALPGLQTPSCKGTLFSNLCISINNIC